MKKREFEEQMKRLQLGLNRRAPIKPSKTHKDKKKYSRKVKHENRSTD